MKRAPLIALAAAAAAGFFGLFTTGHAGEAQVVVTTNILGDVTRQVLGDQVQVTTLIR